MNDKFDELAKGLAQSVTRRQALKKFGLSLVGAAVACLGLANRANAQCIPSGLPCASGKGCCSGVCVKAGTRKPGQGTGFSHVCA